MHGGGTRYASHRTCRESSCRVRCARAPPPRPIVVPNHPPPRAPSPPAWPPTLLPTTSLPTPALFPTPILPLPPLPHRHLTSSHLCNPSPLFTVAFCRSLLSFPHAPLLLVPFVTMASFARRRTFGASKPTASSPYSSHYDDDAYAADGSSASPLTGLPPHIQRHLVAVYATLGAMSAAAASGAVLSARTGFFFGGWLPMLASMAALFVFIATPTGGVGGAAAETRRTAALAVFSAANGAAAGPLLAYVTAVQPALPAVAAGAAAVMFGCLSGAAVLARRRSYLFLGGGLSAALSALLVVSLASSLMRSSAGLGVELWGGLLIFCGYVLYDTQRIIERAHEGDRDAKQAALVLFQDLFSMVVRVALILTRNQQRRVQEERRRRS